MNKAVWEAAYGAAFAQMAMNPSKDSYDKVDQEASEIATQAARMASPEAILKLHEIPRVGIGMKGIRCGEEGLMESFLTGGRIVDDNAAAHAEASERRLDPFRKMSLEELDAAILAISTLENCIRNNGGSSPTALGNLWLGLGDIRLKKHDR